MEIIVKFLIRNIWEKKFRTFLILFSVLMSTALFFSSIAISKNVVNMFMSQAKQRFGTADLIIYANEKSPSPFMHPEAAKGLSGHFDYVIGAAQTTGVYRHNRDEKVLVNVEGITLEDLQTMNPLILAGETSIYPFRGDKIIISKNTSEKYGIQLGSTVEIDINKINRKFRVCGIAQPSGFFLEGGQSTNAVIPKETLASFNGAPGKANMIYIKLKDVKEKKEMISQLSSLYKRYTVEEPISEEELKHETGSISIGFMLMTIIVLFMGVFIIYTSFKVITMERLPVIGTFRSIGATRKTTDWVLLSESIIYGILGGILGSILGIGILYLITLSITPPWMQNVKVYIEFSPIHLLASLILAVVLSFGSSIIPIIKVSKIPVKEIVLNKIEKQSLNKLWKPVLGLVFLAASLILPPVTPPKAALFVDTLCMLLTSSAIVLLVPYLTEIFIRLFEKLYVYVFGNEGILAAKNLRQNKSILNNISLLAIGISSLLMITTISDSVMTEVTSFFETNSTFDVWFHSSNMDKDFSRQLLTVEGVKEIYGNFEANEIEVIGKSEKIASVQGADTTKFLDFLNYEIDGNRQSMLDELNEGRNIMITHMLKEKFNIGLGDKITLKMKEGEREYRVTGFYNTLMNGGNTVLISDKYFKNDMGTRFYSNIFVKASGDPEVVVANLVKKFARLQPSVTSTNEISRMNHEMNSKVFNTMKAFSLMSLLIGTFGIFNNFIISFIERKRSLAVLKSIGMSKGQIIKMMLIESLSGGIVGGITGIISGTLIISITPYVMKAINEPIPIHYSLVNTIAGFILGALINIVASISPAMRSSKLNIIESIKYE